MVYLIVFLIVPWYKYHGIYNNIFNNTMGHVPWYIYIFTMLFVPYNCQFTMEHEIKYLAQANKNTVTVISFTFYYFFFPPIDLGFSFHNLSRIR